MSTGAACGGHGPAGEELRLLFVALLDRFEPGLRSVLAGLRAEAAEHASAAGPEPADSAGTRPPVPGETTPHARAGADGPAGAERAGGGAGQAAACSWCPICSMIALLRGDYPQVGGRLAEGVEALLDGLRASLVARQGSATPDADAAAGDVRDSTAPDRGDGAVPRPAASESAAFEATPGSGTAESPVPEFSVPEFSGLECAGPGSRVPDLGAVGGRACRDVQHIEVRRGMATTGEHPAGSGC